MSDEELEVGFDQLDEALKSRVGGRKGEDGDGNSSSGEEDGGPESGLGGCSHYANSKAGMAVAQEVWGQRPSEKSLSEVRSAWPRA
eukprot:373296-Pyramimonas_sp.AAC.1